MESKEPGLLKMSQRGDDVHPSLLQLDGLDRRSGSDSVSSAVMTETMQQAFGYHNAKILAGTSIPDGVSS